jgi:uncharacterized membrane protein YhfC
MTVWIWQGIYQRPMIYLSDAFHSLSNLSVAGSQTHFYKPSHIFLWVGESRVR